MELESKTFCARHPKTETGLRCASCDTYICPSCLVQTPVGAKCKACASNQNSALYNPSPIQLIFSGAVSLAAGAFAGWAVAFEFGLLTLFFAVLYGQFIANLALRVAGYKRGVRLQVFTGVCMAVGAIGGRLFVAGILLKLPGQVHPPHGAWSVILHFAPMEIIALTVAIASAVGRIKYV